MSQVFEAISNCTASNVNANPTLEVLHIVPSGKTASLQAFGKFSGNMKRLPRRLFIETSRLFPTERE
jgi:hypothetical protein